MHLNRTVSLGDVACALIDTTVKYVDVGDLQNTNLARFIFNGGTAHVSTCLIEKKYVENDDWIPTLLIANRKFNLKHTKYKFRLKLNY